jgi:hypothetical protein
VIEEVVKMPCKLPPWDPSPERKAWDEGFNDGLKTGIEIGLREGLKEAARRMMKDDAPLSYIMVYTHHFPWRATDELEKFIEKYDLYT